MARTGIVYKGILLAVFNKIKLQAKERNLSFKISMEYVGDLFESQEGRCALTGKTLTLKKHTTDTSQTASLDRKDSRKGYIRGNLQWVHKDINRLKSDLHETRFIDLCKEVASHSGKKVYSEKYAKELSKYLLNIKS